MRGSLEIGTKIRALSSVDHVTASTSSSSSSPSTYSCLAQSSPSSIFFSSACSPSLSGHDPANVPEMLRVQEFCVTKKKLASMGFLSILIRLPYRYFRSPSRWFFSCFSFPSSFLQIRFTFQFSLYVRLFAFFVTSCFIFRIAADMVTN